LNRCVNHWITSVTGFRTLSYIENPGIGATLVRVILRTGDMGSRKTEHFGRYEILNELWRGAMGVVYQARDPKIERLVAIKTISVAGQEAAEGNEFRERFLLEARAAGRLSHPGIVTIFDVGEEPETHAPYIVMEYVAGETLQKLLSRVNKLPFATALQCAQELAEALDYAHTQGVVHRDIKPANIMITEDGHAKIADFGIAKLNFSNLTLGGHTLGTPAYMAPEQLEGEHVDGGADLFSMGVILYAMLTGHRPFQGNSASTVSFKVVNKDPVPATAFDANFPPELDYVIGRAMAKDKSHRYQTGREIALDLKELLHGRAPRSIGDPVNPQNSANQPASALQAIHDAVPPVPAHIAAGQSTASNVSPSSSSPYRMGWEAMTVFTACLVVGIMLLLAPHQKTALHSTTVAALTPAAIAANVSPRAPVTAPATSPTAAATSALSSDTHSTLPKPVVYKKPVVRSTSRLEIKIEHHFTSAKFSIWVDRRLAYRHALEGGVKKHLVLFREVDGSEFAKIHLTPGKHQIQVEVESSNGYDQVRTIAADLAPHGTQTLHVHCNGEQEMSVSLE
jgi:serine/threonine protein kinase